jgi:arginine/lysine/ornithine decarboxylase
MDQRETPLIDALLTYKKEERYSFHVPGHKGGHVFPERAKALFQSILEIDATEIEGLDDLYAPTGPIKDAQALLTKFYRTKESLFLVGGSTVGNLVMILSSCKPGDRVFVQRNAHKSIFNALKLARVKPVFLTPKRDPFTKMGVGLSPQTLDEALKKFPETKALVLTYPNYYGHTLPVEELIQKAKKHGLGVLVDEAHGPHFILGEPFPKSTLEMGADLVVHSAHKMLPAMTMGAFFHRNSDWVSSGKIKKVLGMLQTSSPSYPILASLDLARFFLATLDKDKLHTICRQLECFKTQLNEIWGFRIAPTQPSLTDPLKITLQVQGESGYSVKEKFEKLGFFPELADPMNVLLAFGLDYDFPYDRILTQLEGLEFTKGDAREWDVTIETPAISQLAYEFTDFEEQPKLRKQLKDALGFVSGEDVIPYPPGIPVLLEGEYITHDHIRAIQQWMASGASFHGESETTDPFWINVYSKH